MKNDKRPNPLKIKDSSVCRYYTVRAHQRNTAAGKRGGHQDSFSKAGTQQSGGYTDLSALHRGGRPKGSGNHGRYTITVKRPRTKEKGEGMGLPSLSRAESPRFKPNRGDKI